MPTLNKLIQKKSKYTKTFNLEDIRIIIDQIDIPIAIINSETQEINLANNKFCQVSKYTFDELKNNQISRIIGNFNYLENHDGITLSSDFVKKNNEIIHCNYSIRLLGNANRQAMILLELIKEDKEKEIGLLKKLIEKFQLIFGDVISNKKTDIKFFIFDQAVDLFSPVEGALYAWENQDELVKITSYKEKVFPNSIASVEINKLERQDTWTPGKRVLNPIHRAGRINSLPLIITTLIQLNADTNYVLAFAFNEVQYQEILSKYLKIYCEYVVQINEILKTEIENSKLRSSIDFSRKLVELIINNINAGGLIYDQSGKIHQANQFALNLFGYGISEILQEKISNIISDENVLNKLYVSEPVNFCPEESIVIFNRDGRAIPVTISINQLSKETDQLYLMLIENIQELVDQKRKVAALEGKAALGEMVADFAHEVRNPINNISTGLQLVKARLKNDDSNQEVVERMLNDCIRMNHLMDSILSFSRQKYSEFKNVNINQFVQKIVSRFLEKAKSQNIDITLIQEMQDIFIAGDTRALEQVFINIISNAMEILKNEGGVISIKTTINRMKPEMAVITISDTGHGIPEDLRPHLFEPFVSSKPKGTGLGLAITKRIIEAHNGNIHVDTFTTGTIFTITFPLLN